MQKRPAAKGPALPAEVMSAVGENAARKWGAANRPAPPREAGFDALEISAVPVFSHDVIFATGNYAKARSVRGWLQHVCSDAGIAALVPLAKAKGVKGQALGQLEQAREKLSRCLNSETLHDDTDAWLDLFHSGLSDLADAAPALVDAKAKPDAVLTILGADLGKSLDIATLPGLFGGVDVLARLTGGVRSILDGIGFLTAPEAGLAAAAVVMGPLKVSFASAEVTTTSLTTATPARARETMRAGIRNGAFSSALFCRPVSTAQAARLLTGYADFWGAFAARDLLAQAKALRTVCGTEAEVTLVPGAPEASAVHKHDFPENDPNARDVIYVPAPPRIEHPWPQFLMLVHQVQQQQMYLMLSSDAMWHKALRLAAGQRFYYPATNVLVKMISAMPNTLDLPVSPVLGPTKQDVTKMWRGLPQWFREHERVAALAQQVFTVPPEQRVLPVNFGKLLLRSIVKLIVQKAPTVPPPDVEPRKKAVKKAAPAAKPPEPAKGAAPAKPGAPAKPAAPSQPAPGKAAAPKR
jgi:hypothetical protein